MIREVGVCVSINLCELWTLSFSSFCCRNSLIRHLKATRTISFVQNPYHPIRIRYTAHQTDFHNTSYTLFPPKRCSKRLIE